MNEVPFSLLASNKLIQLLINDVIKNIINKTMNDMNLSNKYQTNMVVFVSLFLGNRV